MRHGRPGRGGEAPAHGTGWMRRRASQEGEREVAPIPLLVYVRSDSWAQGSRAVSMSILRVATKPVPERARCFMDNDDLGQLGSASTLLYTTVSIALTLWAVWDPAVPGGGQWIGSPMVLRRPFLADGKSTDVVD